ncbi:MAG: hypothetical protein C4525_10085 [Desulfarculus sp.]|nr:MAG: hypothetical protein C4525_10085 [Desulfarculus sp.]
MNRFAPPPSRRQSQRRAVLTGCTLAAGAMFLALAFSSLLLLLAEQQGDYQGVLPMLLALNFTILAGLVVLVWGVLRLAQRPAAETAPAAPRLHRPFRPQPVLIHGSVERPRHRRAADSAPGWQGAGSG